MENYKKGAACFVIENNKILLTERKAGLLPGYWEVPAGKQGIGETFEETIRREMKEETNLDIEIIKEIGVNINSENKFESHMFLAKVVGGELKNMEPHAHFKVEFVDLQNLPYKLGPTTRKGLTILLGR